MVRSQSTNHTRASNFEATSTQNEVEGEMTFSEICNSDPEFGSLEESPRARFFFFGSLMDAEVLSIVVGRTVEDTEYAIAKLPGYRRLTVFNETYPALIEVPSESADDTYADGLLITLRSQDEIDRVLFFESDEYEPTVTEVILADGSKCTVTLCAAKPSCRLDDAAWDFARWQAEVKPRFLPLARGYMAMHDSEYTEDQIEAEWQRLKNLHQV